MKFPAGRFTDGIVLVTVLVFAALWFGNVLDLATVVASFVPARVLDGGGSVAGSLPVWLTPLTATLLHADWMHLGFNMLMLMFCGRHAESALGGPGMVTVYIVGAYAAAAAQWALDPTAAVPMIGASGAVAAVVGAYALLFGKQRARALGPIPARWVHVAWLAAGWTGLQVLVGLAMTGGTMRIAIAAHIGGFVAGLLLARPLLIWRYRNA